MGEFATVTGGFNKTADQNWSVNIKGVRGKNLNMKQVYTSNEFITKAF